jgi:hypothetical protein
MAPKSNSRRFTSTRIPASPIQQFLLAAVTSETPETSANMSELIESVLSYLPPHAGLLPKWLLFVGNTHSHHVLPITDYTLVGLRGFDRKFLPGICHSEIHTSSL